MVVMFIMVVSSHICKKNVDVMKYNAVEIQQKPPI